ncbi:TPA: hypothetical protein ACN343_003663 [Vibrio parahaemolyticus]|uniref:hypothetical protein n=1 Tax=Vibrio parahaemolyticus TaxID=670 RepID=UPI00040453DA|nr:hypothetical protein [Vibrio parahaemolyticus]EIU7622133.1 hypothetical protein [Vibrio parahaemolyticus]MCC3833573.1 hypothetical protein [Vibrio parahaemolyticus]
MNEEDKRSSKQLGLENINASLKEIVSVTRKHLPEDKWAFLYTYSRKSLDEEIARFQIIDDKSVKLLSTVSVIITIFLAMFNWIIEVSKTDFSIYVYITATALFFTLGIAWFFFFGALKLTYTPRMPLNDSIFALVKDNNMPTIHVALYKTCQNAVVMTRSNIDIKAKKLKYGYVATSCSAAILILLITIVLCESQAEQVEPSPQTKEIINMQNDDQNTPEPEEASYEPDLDITAPDLELICNSEDDKYETKESPED